MTSAAPLSPPAPAAVAAGEGSRKKTILDLPSETQKDIFKHASSTDLIALSLVSKHFRDIAAAQLYRSFHIVFPDEDDPANDSPIDGLASGLDTFVTSEYNYAKYLREIILETLSGGEKGERAYRHYMYDMSCGKFMNTLLLLTLRKAKALETFKWDIRVELSRQVFKALHQIDALQHLHLRMQAGHSIYESPPAILASSILALDETTPPIPVPHHIAPNMLPVSPMPPFPGTSTTSLLLATKLLAKAHQSNARAALLPTPLAVPATLSGFKNLKTLAILDMDTLDYTLEIKACIRNSSATLNTLKISFSETLASRSRKPPPEVHSDDDSDQEDEFGQLIPPPGPPPGQAPSISVDISGPSKALKAQEEKKKQDAVLGKIFGLEPVLLKPRVTTPPKVVPEPETTTEDPKRRFIRQLAPVAARLMAAVNPGSDGSAEGREALALITAAAKQYMESTDKEKDSPAGAPDAGSAGSSTAKVTPVSSSASLDGGGEEDAAGPSAIALAPVQDMPGLFDVPKTTKKQVSKNTEISNPDDIDIEEPESEELAIDFEPSTLATEAPPEPSATPEVASVTAKDKDDTEASRPDSDTMGWDTKIQVLQHHVAICAQHEEIAKEGENLTRQLEEFKSRLESGDLQESDYTGLAAAEAEYQRVSGRLDQLARNLQEVNAEIDDLKATQKPPIVPIMAIPKIEESVMSEYVRTTRGLTLDTLSIYLIPIKASILSKAIDLTVLQHITLLNVGPQIPFWNMLAREHKISTLPLRTIHTDNVTVPFLVFVSQLECLSELYLLERAQKARVESTAAKTTVTMEQIRKLVIKKHASTLRILMIRNDSSGDWDLNIKSALLLCQRAKLLEELAVSFGIRTMHTLLQFMPGLSNLRALHTIEFRTDDTCMWVMREFRKFAVDNISHNPGMKLEYLALDKSVERLVRRMKQPKRQASGIGGDQKGKGKGKATEVGAKMLAELILGGSGGGWPDGGNLGEGSSSSVGAATPDWQESTDDESDIVGWKGLRVETIEGIKFHDVSGVRIFEKDILGGRL